jgi:hypothetical protein
MSVSMQEADNPEAPVIIFDDDHIAEMRRILKDEFASHGNDPARLSRKNFFFIKAKEAVRILDAAGFRWPVELDAHGKYSGVVWMTRALAGLRKRYKNQCPMFIEVF